MKNLKNDKGITLVALVVTVVVLLILSTVSIKLTIGGNGLITESKLIKQNIEEAEKEGQEQINAMKESDVNISQDGVASIKDETPPTINSIEIINITNRSFKINVNIRELGSGIEKVEYSIDNGNTYITPNYNKDTSYTFTGLTSNTEYNVKVKATDKSGNEATISKTVKTKI